MYQLYVDGVYVTEGHSDYLSLAIFTIIKDRAKPNRDIDIKLVWVE